MGWIWEEEKARQREKDGVKEEVKKIVEKHWDSNWHDSRTIEGEVEWIMSFFDELVQVWLRKFGKEMERAGTERGRSTATPARNKRERGTRLIV